MKIQPILIGYLACMLFGATSFGAQPNPVPAAGVAYVGHSLINNRMPSMVEDIAKSLSGANYWHAVQVINGSPIIYNWNNCRSATSTEVWPPEAFACDAIENGTPQGLIDTLIVTQVNTIYYPNEPNQFSGTPEDYNRFLKLFKQNRPNGRAFYYTQWEALDFSRHAGRDWTDWIAEELAFYERAVQATEQNYLAQNGQAVDIQIIPAALGIRDLIREMEGGRVPGYTSRQQIFEDVVHLNDLGNYFVACMVFASVFERSPVGATGLTDNKWGAVLTNLDAPLALRLQQLAWKVVSDYRGWSATATKVPRAPGNLTVQ